jgi:hypothetical protein
MSHKTIANFPKSRKPMPIQKWITRLHYLLKKPITPQVVGFWLSILFGFFMGRTLKCRRCRKKFRRTFPFVFRGKLYLFGLWADFVRPVFDAQYSMSFECIECTSQIATEQKVRRARGPAKGEKPARIHHFVLGHTAPAHLEPLLSYMQSLSPDVPVVLFHGGQRESFEKINWHKKVFCADPNLRGLSSDHNHRELFNAMAQFARDEVSGEDWILFTEADCIPLQRNYAEEVTRLAGLARADFAACNLHNQTFTNADWYQREIKKSEWLGVIARNSCREHCDQVYHYLGCLMLCRAHFLQRWLDVSHPSTPVYFEIYVPTLAYHLGLEMVNLYDLSHQFDFCRYRPEFEASSVPEALEKDALFLHPAKWGMERFPEFLRPLSTRG